MATHPQQNSDADLSGIAEQPYDQIATRLQRAVAYYDAKRRSDLNVIASQAKYDPVTKKRYFEDAPLPLKRLLGSPLKTGVAQPDGNGRRLVGPNGERLVTSGWGDARSVAFDDQVDANRRHGGLDFRAPVGETVFAAADGIVTFVGYQGRPTGGHSLVGAQTDARGNLLDANGNLIGPPTLFGHGGIFIQIRHFGDFSGYGTEYMHLSKVLVQEGATVHEGDAIGHVGQSGGNRGITSGPHLHFQVRFQGVIVRPTALVPHYWPGHEDETDNSTGQAMASLLKNARVPAGLGVVMQNAAGTLQTLERAAGVEGLTATALKEHQADHSQLVAKKLALNQSALYEAVAKFQQASPQVQSPMTFDFDTGVWSDGKPV